MIITSLIVQLGPNIVRLEHYYLAFAGNLGLWLYSCAMRYMQIKIFFPNNKYSKRGESTLRYCVCASGKANQPTG